MAPLIRHAKPIIKRHWHTPATIAHVLMIACSVIFLAILTYTRGSPAFIQHAEAHGYHSHALKLADDSTEAGTRLALRKPPASTKPPANTMMLKDYRLCDGANTTQVSDLIPSNLLYMQRRWEYMKQDWLLAMAWMREKEPAKVQKLCGGPQKQQRILLYFGAFIHDGMTGLHGSPQGEHIQWHDLYISLILTGYNPELLSTRIPLTTEFLDKYDVIISDYTGVAHAMDSATRERHKCKLRILDSYGTDQSYNMKTQGGPYCCLHLNLKQFYTFMPGFSPDNSFLGYAVRSFRPVEEMQPKHPKRLHVLLYGKEFNFFGHEQEYIQRLVEFAPTHATATGWIQGALPGVENHGFQSNVDLHNLMTTAFVYAGFPAVLMGPAAMEAISQGMVFLNYALDPAWNLSARQDKPTTQLWHSQFPFLESFEPHVITINPRSSEDVKQQLTKVRRVYEQWWGNGNLNTKKPPEDILVEGHIFLAKTRGHRTGFVPVEYTTVGMLQRVDQLMRLSYCDSDLIHT